MNLEAKSIIEEWASEQFQRVYSYIELMDVCDRLINADCYDIAQNLKDNWREYEEELKRNK